MSEPKTTYTENILKIKSAYTEPGYFVEGHMSVPSKSIKNSGFLGSPHVVFMTSSTTITHDAPACIASPLISMIAKDSITLGVGSKDLRDKVVIYAPEQFAITTKHLMVGNISLLVEPKFGFISCKKLTLVKSPGKDPDYFALIKSWLIHDDVKIETIVTPYPKDSLITVEVDTPSKRLKI